MISSAFLIAALAASVNAHGVITNAQGVSGSPASVGFQVNLAIARNCTGISPCQQDTTIIRDAEISANIVNECGRTELSGNIDVGENTENALAAGAVTQVVAGTVMSVTIHQVNADGAGPYSCDLDQTSNAGIISQNLTVTNNVPGVNGLSQNKTQDFTINVAMPTNLACTGASTGNVCTVRCRNNAVAGPFGGCFAVQQTDVSATNNTAAKITTSQTLAGIDAQVAENIVDLPVAVAANQVVGTSAQVDALAANNKLLGVTVTEKAAAVQTLAVENVGNNVAIAAGTGTAKLTNAAASATRTATKTATAASATSTKTSKSPKTSTAASATSTKTSKSSKNNQNNKRDSALKWAKRMVESVESVFEE